MIFITSTGELLLYFIVIFFILFSYKIKNSAAGLFSCAIFMLQENKLQWIENF